MWKRLARSSCVAQNAYIGIDTANGDGEHAVEIGARPAGEGDQVPDRKNTGEKTSLDRTTDETVNHRVGLLEAGFRTRKDDPKGDCSPPRSIRDCAGICWRLTRNQSINTDLEHEPRRDQVRQHGQLRRPSYFW